MTITHTEQTFERKDGKEMARIEKQNEIVTEFMKYGKGKMDLVLVDIYHDGLIAMFGFCFHWDNKEYFIKIDTAEWDTQKYYLYEKQATKWYTTNKEEIEEIDENFYLFLS